MRMEPTPPAAPPTSGQSTDRTKMLLFVLVGLLAVAVAVLATVLVLRDPDDGASSAPQPTPSVTSTTSTTSAPTSETTTSTSTLSPDEARGIVWPRPGGAVYDDPVEAAVTMATDLVGFTSPIAGEFQAGDARSGEVPIRAKSTGAVTTVQVRQLGDGYWYVLGAATDDLRLESPDAGAAVSSPVTVSGRSRAFEGTIVVSVHAQADAHALGQQPLIGGAGEDLGPFTGEIEFDAPSSASPGALVVLTESAEDGRVWQATVVPVMLTP
jgi:hypothetical protein